MNRIEVVLLGFVSVTFVVSIVVVEWIKIERRKAAIAEAIDVFGDIDRAQEWLHRENRVLGQTPFSLLYTRHGSKAVMKVLSSIKYGDVV